MERIEKLKKFLDENKEDSFLRHALALEYIKRGEDVKAQPLFESILNKDPGYIGTYYHLGKLLERNNKSNEAIEIYQNGMNECKKQGDRHTFNELQAAFEELGDL